MQPCDYCDKDTPTAELTLVEVNACDLKGERYWACPECYERIMVDSPMPKDPVTRRMVAKVLAEMIRDDFWRAKREQAQDSWEGSGSHYPLADNSTGKHPASVDFRTRTLYKKILGGPVVSAHCSGASQVASRWRQDSSAGGRSALMVGRPVSVDGASSPLRREERIAPDQTAPMQL